MKHKRQMKMKKILKAKIQVGRMMHMDKKKRISAT
jgi:hypothetical protein